MESVLPGALPGVTRASEPASSSSSSELSPTSPVRYALALGGFFLVLRVKVVRPWRVGLPSTARATEALTGGTLLLGAPPAGWWWWSDVACLHQDAPVAVKCAARGDHHFAPARAARSRTSTWHTASTFLPLWTSAMAWLKASSALAKVTGASFSPHC